MKLIKSVRAYFTNVAQSEAGVTAIEYAMIAALVAVGLAASLTTLKTAVAGVFTSVGSAF